MKRRLKIVASLSTAALGLCFAGTAVARPPSDNSPAAQRLAHTRKRKTHSIASVPASPQTQVEAAQQLLVSCQNGLLFISAQNARLGDVLDQVRGCTGASIAAPPDINERIAIRVGPEPPAQAIATLLEGSSFNYLIAGEPNNPGAVASVTLSLKPTGPDSYVPPTPVADDTPVQSRAMVKADLTGGDEGVWDDVNVPASVPAPPPPAAPAIYPQ
jgi:hypothetical protein